jgi:hypothetical protein
MFTRRVHLTDEELICFLDGEASRAASNRMEKHLATCADCRLRRQSFEGATTEFAELHRTAFDPQMQSGSEAHERLKEQLAPIQQTTPHSLIERLTMAVRSQPWAYRYVAVAIAVLSIAVLSRQGHFFQLESMPQMESRLLPDSGLTPGATRTVELADICPQSDDDDLDPAVSPSLKEAVFQEYGVTALPVDSFQVDYLINPQLGGTDDVRNLWPEPYRSKVWNARAKDALESRLHNMVCSQQIDLAQAQHEIATNWIAAYKKYFHTAHPA